MKSVTPPPSARNGRRPATRRKAAAPAAQPPQPDAPGAAALALALYPDLLPAYAAAGPVARGRFATLAAGRSLLRSAGESALPLAHALAGELTALRGRLVGHAARLHDGADAAYLAFWSVGLDPAAGDDTGPAALTAAADALTRLADHVRRAEDALAAATAPARRADEAAAFLASLTGGEGA